MTQERNAKRPKVGLQARLNKSRARPIANIPWGKRTKITGKTTTLDAQQKWKDVFDKILKEVPRVGKIVINDPIVLPRVSRTHPRQKDHSQQSPFDPCLFILRDSNSGQPDGILGLHVDDGLCAGNERFLKVLEQLERSIRLDQRGFPNSLSLELTCPKLPMVTSIYLNPSM